MIVGTVGSAIAVAVLTLGVTAAKSSSSLERSTLARALSEACVETALKQIVLTTTYTGTGTVTLGQGTCSYAVTQPSSPTRLISTTSTIGVVVRKMRVNVTINTVPGLEIAAITSWQEDQ